MWGGFTGDSGEVARTTRTGEWSDDRSKQDVAVAKVDGIPFVTQKSSRSGGLLLLEGQ
jgi:hypothetical protein